MQYINFTGEKYSLTGVISSVKRGERKVFFKEINGYIEEILWTGQSFTYDIDEEFLKLSPGVLKATYYENKPTVTHLKEVEYKDVCEVLSWGQGAFYQNKETNQIEQIQIVGDHTMNTYTCKMAIYRGQAKAWYIKENSYEGEKEHFQRMGV